MAPFLENPQTIPKVFEAVANFTVTSLVEVFIVRKSYVATKLVT